MNDTGTAPDSDVKCTLLGHIRDDGGRVASDAVSLLKELAGPDGLFGVTDGASDAVAVFEQLVDDVHAC